MKAEEILFSLLRHAVCGQPLEDGIKESCTEETLRAVLALAQTHDLAHLVAHGLEDWDLPASEALTKLRTAKAQAIFRYMRQDYEYGRICDVLERGKIPHIPLKGAVLRRLYPEAWMRTSCDIDILIHEEDLENAVNLLVKELSMTTDRKKDYHDVSLFSPNGVHLELHFSIQENMENIDGLLSRVWEFTSPVTEYGFSLQKEFLIFHLIAHMSYHFTGGGCGIRPVLDLYLLRKTEAYEDRVLRGYLASCSLETFYDNGCLLMDVWFEGKPHSALTMEMQTYLLSGGVYGSQEQRLAVQLEQKGGRVTYLLQRIFMPHRELKIRYRILEKYPILHPICQVMRWIGLLFSGKLKRSVGELKLSTRIRKEQSKKIRALLRDVGL